MAMLARSVVEANSAMYWRLVPLFKTHRVYSERSDWNNALSAGGAQSPRQWRYIGKPWVSARQGANPQCINEDVFRALEERHN